MGKEPLDVIINCGRCSREAAPAFMNEMLYNSSVAYARPKANFTLLESPFHDPSCKVCIVIYEFLKRRRYNLDMINEWRKDK